MNKELKKSILKFLKNVTGKKWTIEKMNKEFLKLDESDVRIMRRQYIKEQ